MANKATGKEEKEALISLQTGACGIIPFMVSEKCEQRRRRKEDVCKECWRNSK